MFQRASTINLDWVALPQITSAECQSLVLLGFLLKEQWQPWLVGPLHTFILCTNRAYFWIGKPYCQSLMFHSPLTWPMTYMGLSLKTSKKLQLAKNTAIQVVEDTAQQACITLLPLTCIVVIYKALHGTGPRYLTAL